MELTITPDQTTSRRHRYNTRKTRSFKATYIAHLVANTMWPGGATSSGNTRPVWLTIAGTEKALRPFCANLQLGKIATIGPPENPLTYSYNSSTDRIELLKSAGYRSSWQRITGTRQGTIARVTVYLPDLFIQDPGLIDPERISFIALTPHWWTDQETANLPDTDRHLILRHVHNLPASHPVHQLTDAQIIGLVPQATYTCTMLEKRTTRPLVATYPFYVQLYLAALQQGIFAAARQLGPGEASMRNRDTVLDDDTVHSWTPRPELDFAGYGLAEAGLHIPIACHQPHANVDSLLAKETETYFRCLQRSQTTLQERAA